MTVISCTYILHLISVSNGLQKCPTASRYSAHLIPLRREVRTVQLLLVLVAKKHAKVTREREIEVGPISAIIINISSLS